MQKELIDQALRDAVKAGDPEELLTEALITRATLLLLPGYAEIEAQVRDRLIRRQLGAL